MFKLKICGLTDPENIQDVVKLSPDMAGFIFYSKSERNVSIETICDTIPNTIQRVGVFVNSKPSDTETIIEKFKLNALQLYHEEIAPFQYLRSKVQIIKAISIKTEDDLDKSKSYESQCDLFLFDTKGEKVGGNGIKFDWRMLKTYTGETPFLLSGGIGPEDVESIKAITHPKLIGIDINSKFEIRPGIKNIHAITQFKKELYENIEYTG